jgi:hypothetical protein
LVGLLAIDEKSPSSVTSRIYVVVFSGEKTKLQSHCIREDFYPGAALAGAFSAPVRWRQRSFAFSADFARIALPNRRCALAGYVLDLTGCFYVCSPMRIIW